MELVLGALPSLLPKLTELLAGEYNLQKEVKGGIRFLQAELDSMKAALQDISETPPDQLRRQDKIWACNVRELSYDIEDNVDLFMLQFKGSQPVKKHGFNKFVDKTLSSLMQPKIRRKIAIDIRDIKSRVIEVHERRRRYEVNYTVDKPIKVDPRALVRYEDMSKLVGINEARDEVIKLLIETDEVSKQHDKIVSIVGFGGLGKTTLANVVYEKLRAQFDSSAFVSVSQTPDMDKLFKDMFYQLAKYKAANIDIISVINELREFLQKKMIKKKKRRCFIIIDDIWETSYWNMIRHALPNVSAEYRIITTTRILTVAEQIGGVYKMKPLSLENSRILMYGRIFGEEAKGKCPDEQLTDVSNKILYKCAGVPLAIITIASLLASKGRNKLEWYDVFNSIGAGLEGNNTVENMRKVLSLSYYDLPYHLRTCLLYISVFPEDYDIEKDRLIWLWIAEGFIKSGKRDKSLFEMGESYLNELINRSMVQPKYDNDFDTVVYCCVHDMVLDLIIFLSNEENFVSIWDGFIHQSSMSEKVRRISIQNGKAGHGKPEATMSIECVRSVVVFPPAVAHIPTLQNRSVLRVLDLEHCDLSQGYSLKYIGNLLHLRYLGLRGTNIKKLPEEIGNLQFLQTLELRDNEIYSLPSTIVQLTHLMCLHKDETAIVPKGIRSLTNLEELALLRIDDGDMNVIEELGHLTELKALGIFITFSKKFGYINKSLVKTLNKLHKVQVLYVFSVQSNLLVDLVLPRHLRILHLTSCWLSTLAPWVNPSHLLDLSSLEIGVRGLQQEDLEILGRLPALRNLDLMVDHEVLGIHGRFIVVARSFPCLVYCMLDGFGGPVVFEQGAMPRLAKLRLEFPVQETREFNGSFELGLGNLPSLEDVSVWVVSGGVGNEEVEEAKTAVRHTIEVHPNHPTLTIADFWP